MEIKYLRKDLDKKERNWMINFLQYDPNYKWPLQLYKVAWFPYVWPQDYHIVTARNASEKLIWALLLKEYENSDWKYISVDKQSLWKPANELINDDLFLKLSEKAKEELKHLEIEILFWMPNWNRNNCIIEKWDLLEKKGLITRHGKDQLWNYKYWL